MCVTAAKGVELQCQHKYWGTNTDTSKVTCLNNLTSDQLKNLPTNNLNTERYLSKFGYLASQSAQHSNRFFKAKRIRDDLVLSGAIDVEKSSNKVAYSKTLMQWK